MTQNYCKIDIENIFSIAQTFRTALDKAHKAGKFIHDGKLCFFPNNCCGEVSRVLGHHLLQFGIDSEYICGEYYKNNIRQTHAWLRIKNSDIIVDITGDQFKHNPVFLNYDLPVYVGIIDSMHLIFDTPDRCVSDSITIQNFDFRTQIRFEKIYTIALSYI